MSPTGAYVCKGIHVNRAFPQQEQAEGEEPGGPVTFNPRSGPPQWTWSMGGDLCLRFTPSPGGEPHSPWAEVCVDTGLGLNLEQKV